MAYCTCGASRFAHTTHTPACARMRDKIMNVANVAVNIHIIIKHQSQ